MTLKQQLQKTGEEFDKTFRFNKWKEKHGWECDGCCRMDEITTLKQFIRQAQINAVKAFAEEVREWLSESSVWSNDYIFLRKIRALEKFDEEIKTEINNLLKDV